MEVFHRFSRQRATSKSSPLNPNPSTPMNQDFRNMIKVFRNFDQQSQQNIIDRISNRGEENLAQYLRKIRDMQQRGKKIEELAKSIIDKLES
jgi:endonuclease III